MIFRLLICLFAMLLLAFPSHGLAAKIVIDAGHGGFDPGAIGVNGLREKDVNLDIALKLQEELLHRGYEVIMTRGNDTFLSLEERVNIARKSGADLFVSVHANSHPRQDARGSLVLYYDNRYPNSAYPASKEMAALTSESSELASRVLDGLVSEVQTENRGLVPSSVYVVRRGNIPSILVETAFLSNYADAALLASDSVRSRMALGIANGIDQYKPPAFTDIIGHWARGPIERLAERGIVRGYERKYEPDKGMTRAEFVTMLDNVFSLDQMLNALQEQQANGSDEEQMDASNPEDVADHADDGDSAASAQFAANAAVPAAPDHADDPDADSETADETVAEPPVFPDVSAGHWAYGTLMKAAKLKVLNGFEDGSLRPDDFISRAEMAAVFDRIAAPQPDLTDVALPFNDTVPDSWYALSVSRMAALGLMGGYEDASFRPHRSMTRAEAASVLDRYLGSL